MKIQVAYKPLGNPISFFVHSDQNNGVNILWKCQDYTDKSKLQPKSDHWQQSAGVQD